MIMINIENSTPDSQIKVNFSIRVKTKTSGALVNTVKKEAGG